MPKFRSAESLLQLCLESVCKLIRNCSENASNELFETTSTENALEETESVSKCVANPFEKLHSTLLEQVINTLSWVRNIKELNLLTTKQTRKLDLCNIHLYTKYDLHYALQLAASRCLKLTTVMMGRSGTKFPLEYYQKFLPQFKHLQVLNVVESRENFDDSCLHLLGIHCIDLRELDISYCNVTDYGMEQLCGGVTVQGEEKLKSLCHGQCKAIQELTIDGTKITVKGVQMALLHLPDLKIFKSSLVIGALRATHQNESLICAKYALLVLELRETSGYLYQNGDLRHAASRCPFVTHLDIGIDVGITDSDLLGVMTLEGLRYLKLSSCQSTLCRITFGGGLAPLLQARGHSLKSLELDDLPESVPVYLGTLVECCRSLERLVFYDIFLRPGRLELEEDERTSSRPSKRTKSDFVLYHLKELKLGAAAGRLHRHLIKELLLLSPLTLKKLTFLHCNNLDDDTLRQVFQLCSFKNLEVLAVGSCQSITKNGINLFLNGENALNNLAVYGCTKVSDDDIRNWEDQAKKNNWELLVAEDFVDADV